MGNEAGSERARWGLIGGALLAVAGFGAACSPTVKVQAPEKPITINLNVKIEHEVRVKIERDVEALIDANSDLF